MIYDDWMMEETKRMEFLEGLVMKILTCLVLFIIAYCLLFFPTFPTNCQHVVPTTTYLLTYLHSLPTLLP